VARQQLLPRVAAQPAGGRVDVDQPEAGVGDDDRIRRVLDDLGVPAFGEGQLIARLAPLGHVDRHRRCQRPSVGVGQGERHRQPVALATVGERDRADRVDGLSGRQHLRFPAREAFRQDPATRTASLAALATRPVRDPNAPLERALA